MTETQTPESSTKPKSAEYRGSCLTLWLGFGFVGGFFAIYSYTLSNAAYKAAGWPEWALMAYALITALMMVAIYGIWNWKHWGLKLYYVMLIAHVLVSLIAMGNFGSLIGGALAAGIVYWLTKPHLGKFQ